MPHAAAVALRGGGGGGGGPPGAAGTPLLRWVEAIISFHTSANVPAAALTAMAPSSSPSPATTPHPRWPATT
jgi:hypothetical protein